MKTDKIVAFSKECVVRAKPTGDVTDDMQIFKTILRIEENLYKRLSLSQLEKMKERKTQEHLIDLGRAAIYGCSPGWSEGSGTQFSHLYSLAEYPIRYMDGVMAQTGGAPKDSDIFRFRYLQGNGITRFFSRRDWWEDFVEIDGEMKCWLGDLDMAKPPVEYREYCHLILSECRLEKVDADCPEG